MTSQSPTEQSQSLEALQDIRRMMERSSRFISLSGLSGVSAGICALIGAGIAHLWLVDYWTGTVSGSLSGGDGLREETRGSLHGANPDVRDIQIRLVALALGVLIAALATSTWFTWRKARKNQLPIWDHASKKLAVNMAIPLATGGFFVLALIHYSDWVYVAPACLIFYGLALVNASKFTLTDIRYLGLLEIALGCISMYYPHEGLYFWAAGFGVLHIIYGLIMWWKYERP
jgi:hypothetical protein